MFLLIDEQMGATGKVARGRQVLNTLWHDLTSGIYITIVVTWQTLGGVQLSGNNLTDFNHRRYKVLKEIRIDILITQLEMSSVLTDDMKCFGHLPVNHLDRTYTWSMSMMQKHIHKHTEKNLQREPENCKGGPHGIVGWR